MEEEQQEQQEQQEPYKKPKGWYGQRVAELDKEFLALVETVEQLRAELRSDLELKRLANHPMLVNYENFYDRFRRLELTMDTLSAKVGYFESRINGIEKAVQQLTAPRGRGA